MTPVLIQPALPLPLGAERQADLRLSDEELATVKARVVEEPCPVLGLRFTEDPFVRARVALDRVMAFFAQRLIGPAGGSS